jgi:hypothetical protein
MYALQLRHRAKLCLVDHDASEMGRRLETALSAKTK